MKLDVYENLRRINRGFELVIEGLAALRKHGAFHRDTLARFAALSLGPCAPGSAGQPQRSRRFRSHSSGKNGGRPVFFARARPKRDLFV